MCRWDSQNLHKQVGKHIEEHTIDKLSQNKGHVINQTSLNDVMSSFNTLDGGVQPGGGMNYWQPLGRGD